MTPYDKIDGVISEFAVRMRLPEYSSKEAMDIARDALYTILEETIEDARHGVYAD